MDTWFLLFDGDSPDGRGSPDYIGRTLDKEKAKKHCENCRKNPYSTGKVVIVTENGYELAWDKTDWEAL